jgi:hypothetical protein
MSHRQHQAGCPPTVQRGSGSSPRCRQSSTVSRWTLSRSPISASPTGSCFVCWSAMERRRQLPVGKAMPWELAPAVVDTRSVGREFVLGYPAASGPRPAGRGRDARRPAGGGDPPGGPPGAKRSPGVHTGEARGPSARPFGVAKLEAHPARCDPAWAARRWVGLPRDRGRSEGGNGADARHWDGRLPGSPGENICALYSGSAERDALLGSYVRTALRSPDKCICILDSAEEEQMTRMVTNVGNDDKDDLMATDTTRNTSRLTDVA